MVIDLILDRKDGIEYDAKQFYNDVMGYGEIGWDITRAMGNDKEYFVKLELKKYIINNDYNHKICDYIDEVNWL